MTFGLPSLAPGTELVTAIPTDDIALRSVTTIIDVLDKPALQWWAAEETAKAAVRKQKTWQGMIEDSGEEAAIDWLRKARFDRDKSARTARELGSAVHAVLEEYALTGVRPEVGDDDEVRAYLDRFDEWCQRNSPSYQAAELTVFSPGYGYAGTCDAFLTLDGVRLITDYKSTRNDRDRSGKPTSPYPEVALQLAAYRYAEFAAVWRARRYEKGNARTYLLNAAEQAMAISVPEVDGAAVIHITPNRCEAYAVRADRIVYDAFLFTLEVARWKAMENTAIGDVLGKTA